jgi:hypothetical protein
MLFFSHYLSWRIIPIEESDRGRRWVGGWEKQPWFEQYNEEISSIGILVREIGSLRSNLEIILLLS